MSSCTWYSTQHLCGTNQHSGLGCLWYFPSPDELIFKALFPHSQPAIGTKEEDHKDLNKTDSCAALMHCLLPSLFKAVALLKRLLCNSATPRASGTSGAIEKVCCRDFCLWREQFVQFLCMCNNLEKKSILINYGVARSIHQINSWQPAEPCVITAPGKKPPDLFFR